MYNVNHLKWCDTVHVWGKFWSGKKWRIESHFQFYLPIISFWISCSYTCSSFTNILPLQNFLTYGKHIKDNNSWWQHFKPAFVLPHDETSDHLPCEVHTHTITVYHMLSITFASSGTFVHWLIVPLTLPIS